MMIYSLLLIVVLLAYSSAFTGVVPASRTSTTAGGVTKTTLYLDLPADPLVLAAGGVAVVGAIGTAVISGKLNDLDAEEAASAPAPAPEVEADSEPVAASESEAET